MARGSHGAIYAGLEKAAARRAAVELLERETMDAQTFKKLIGREAPPGAKA